ncbi:MAG: DUF6455 family protein [Hyphomicrobiales bacterium]
MARKRFRNLRRRLAARHRRHRYPVLARALGSLSDAEIDTALADAGLSRVDLFTPRDAVATHRSRMACMLKMLEVDVVDAVERDWETLKQADHVCSRCAEVGRCRRWLEWGGVNEAPMVFCPNAAAFRALAAGQARRKLGGYLV